MRQFIKLLTPPLVLNIYRRIFNYRYGWKGDYETWKDAKDISTGYDADTIVQTVKKSLLKVKKGEEVYERDSVIFDKIQYSWPLLFGLMFATLKSKSINVLDFGGSLGSTYYQNKFFLDRIDNVSWSIVEQNKFVKVGKEEFEDERLNFFYTVDDCIQKNKADILLLSSVLQYIESPYELLDEILQYDFKYILIDRTPFSKNSSKIVLQTVPPSVYNASYPCHFFDESVFVKYFLNKNFRVLESFVSVDGVKNECIFKGMILENFNN
jgi:putative methyltransferase (TIGR04325 family)